MLKLLQKQISIFSFPNADIFRMLGSLLLLSVLAACNSPTNKDLNGVTGFVEPTKNSTSNSTVTVNGPLGNSALSFAPGSNNYGALVVNSGTGSQVFTVTNASSYSVVLGATSGTTAQFTQTASTCTNGLIMAPNATCSLTIQFAPNGGGNFSTAISIAYTAVGDVTSFVSNLNVTGQGTTLVSFAGIGSLSNITSTSMKVNWTGVAGADSYQIYRISGGNSFLVASTLDAVSCVATVCAYTVTGLTPNTSYTFKVLASDVYGVQDSNINTQTQVSQNIGTFTAIGALAANEGSAAQTANMSCTDGYASANLFAITAQTDPATNCSLTATTGAAAKVTCTPSYKAVGGVHNPWAGNVTVSCTINGSVLTQTFAVNVSNTNRAPVIALSNSSAQTVSAQMAVSSVTAKDSNTNSTTDIDGDAITFSCTFSGGGFGAGTSCTSLPASSYSMGAGTGIFTWTPSLAAAVGGLSTTYAISLKGTDGSGANSSSSFNVTVNPGLALSIPGGNVTSSQMQLSWTNVTGASSYTVYRVSPSAATLTTMLASSCGASCTYTATSLSLNTSYTFYVVALDAVSAVFSTSLNASATTLLGKLAFGGSSSVIAANCGTITMTTQDNSNNPIVLGANSTVTISGLGSGSLYSNAGCTVGIANPTILSGQSSITFYIKDLVAESLSLGATLAGYTPATAGYTISNGTADHIVLSAGDAQTGAHSQQIGILPKAQVVDQWGNGVSGVSVQFQPYIGGGLAGNQTVTTDSNGFAQTIFYPGVYDLINKMIVRKTGVQLPAVVGNAFQTFSITSQFGNTAIEGQNFSTGTSPLDMVIADINNDGFPDILTANNVSNTFSVIMNNGNGTFAANVDYATGTGAYGILTGDFNGDTWADVIVTTFNGGAGTTFNYYQNNGNGTFAAGVPYTTGAGPVMGLAHDFNGDGKLDVVILNYNANTMSYFAGNGNGTFVAKVDYVTGTGPFGISKFDYDGDGKMDVAVSNFGSNTVSILKGNGNGTFQAKVDYATGAGPVYNATADLNGDGKPDLVVPNYSAATVSVFLGQGAAGSYTFAAKNDFTVAANPYSIPVIRDFDGDGKLDFAVANASTPGQVSYLYGNGAGVFSSLGVYIAYDGTASIPHQLAPIDVNNNGNTTLAVLVSTPAKVVLLPKIKSRTMTGAAAASYAITSVDLNNDGNMDLISTSYTASGQVSVFLGNGNGTFGARTDYAGGANTAEILTGDFNNDGKVDVIVGNYGGAGFSFFPGVGNGTLGARTDKNLGWNPWKGAAGDFNNDGKLDVAFSAYAANAVGTLAGDGAGGFSCCNNYAVGTSPYALAMGDVNNDGKLDIVVVNYGSNNISVLIGNGDATFQAAVNYSVGAGTLPVNLSLGDVNGDGKLDVVVACAGNPGKVAVMLNNGSGGFPTSVLYASGRSTYETKLTDWNGDGKLDVVALSYTDGNITVLTGDGTGVFTAARTFGVGGNGCGAEYMTLGDFDKNGKIDIGYSCASTSDLGILLGF